MTRQFTKQFTTQLTERRPRKRVVFVLTRSFSRIEGRPPPIGISNDAVEIHGVFSSHEKATAALEEWLGRDCGVSQTDCDIEEWTIDA